MRILYRYVDAALAERFLRRIDNENGLELTPVRTFSQLKRLLKAIGDEPALIVVEKTSAEDTQVLDLLRNAATPMYTRKVMALIFAIAPDPESTKETIERAGGKYMLRRNGSEAEEALVESLAELRRLLRRVLSKGLLRIAVTGNYTARIWVRDRNQIEHEWVLSPKFSHLVVVLARNRYSTILSISKALGIKPKSVNTYLDRLRGYFDAFNSKKLHLPFAGKNLFETIHYADLNLYRVTGVVEWSTKNTG